MGTARALLLLLVVACAALTVALVGVLWRSAPAETASVPPLVGVDVRLFGSEDREGFRRTASAFKQIGGVYVRQTFPWMGVEPRQGRYEWARCDRVVDQVAESGLRLLVTLAYCPKWARMGDGPPRSGPPREPAQFAEYVYQVVSRYKGRVSHYEIWNEADWVVFWDGGLSFPERVRHYRATLKAAQAAARRADPAARVVFTGMALADGIPVFEESLGRMRGGLPPVREVRPIPPGETGPDWLAAYLSEPASEQWFDIFACHVLRPSQDEVIASATRVLAQRGVRKPLWITESGWPSGPPPGDSPESQAVFIENAYHAAWRAGAEVFVWHEMVDNGGDPSNRESHYGLFTADLREKPVFQRLRELLTRKPRGG